MNIQNQRMYLHGFPLFLDVHSVDRFELAADHACLKSPSTFVDFQVLMSLNFDPENGFVLIFIFFTSSHTIEGTLKIVLS